MPTPACPDYGLLWHESGPWGNVPSARGLLSANVFRFQALNEILVYVLDGESRLWSHAQLADPLPLTQMQVDANVFPLTLPSSPSAVQIALDWPSITFDNGVPVGGCASVEMNSDGECAFSGHFHDSGFPDYDVQIAWAVVDSRGVAYTFGA